MKNTIENIVKNMSDDEVEMLCLKYAEDELYSTAMDEAGVYDHLDNANEKIRSLASVPVIGGLVEELFVCVRMLQDSVAGEYKLSNTVWVAIFGMLVYLVSPIDLIPDYIPFIGYIDDGTVIRCVLSAFAMEIEHYKQIFTDKKYMKLKNAIVNEQAVRQDLDNVIFYDSNSGKSSDSDGKIAG